MVAATAIAPQPKVAWNQRSRAALAERTNTVYCHHQIAHRSCAGPRVSCKSRQLKSRQIRDLRQPGVISFYTWGFRAEREANANEAV
jgi:hypothetical protein